MKIEDRLKNFNVLLNVSSMHMEEAKRGLKLVAGIKGHSISSFNVESPDYTTARDQLSIIYHEYFIDLKIEELNRHFTAKDVKKAKNATTSALKALEGIPKPVRDQIKWIIRRDIKDETPIHDPFDGLAWLQSRLQTSYFRSNVAKGAKKHKPRKSLIANLYHLLKDYVSEPIPTQGTRVEGVCVVTEKPEKVFVNIYHESIFIFAYVLDEDLTRENVSGALKVLKATQQK